MKDSIFTRTRNAGTESDDLASYCNNMAPITCKVGSQLFVLGLVALMMAIGLTHLNECPVNSLIPVYLIASGGLYVGWLAIEICCDQCEYPNLKIYTRIFLSLSGIGLYIAASFIEKGAGRYVIPLTTQHAKEQQYLKGKLASHVNEGKTGRAPIIMKDFGIGNIWIYGAWEDVETREKILNNDDYCNPWVYWVAFANITVVTALNIIALFSLLSWCLLVCCVKVCCKGAVDETTPLTAASSSDSPA